MARYSYRVITTGSPVVMPSRPAMAGGAVVVTVEASQSTAVPAPVTRVAKGESTAPVLRSSVPPWLRTEVRTPRE
ncbi:hypothetical protein [Streptomyces sp. NPDC001070]